MNAFQPPGGRPGHVSVWVGNFPSVEAAEVYFGLPDEIGVYLPAEDFAADFCLPEFPPENLEVNFEQVEPRPLRALLEDATFSASFLDLALAAAAARGLREAQGVALLYDYDDRANPGHRDAAGPLAFVGAWPYVKVSPQTDCGPYHALAERLGYCWGAVLFVAGALGELSRKRRAQRGDGQGHVTAREYCEYLLACRGKLTAGCLAELGLRRSEDVGRVMFGLVEGGLVRGRESDREEDFRGLFALE